MSWASIRAKAIDLAESKGLQYNDPQMPSTRLRRLASELGIDRLELREMEGDALVTERSPGKFTISLNSGHVKSRHRFSTAHEAAHLLVAPMIGHRSVHRRRYSPTQDDEGRRLEVLCNDMASAILMPRERVKALLHQTGQSAACIHKMTRDFDVSFEAAARRYVHVVSLPCALVKWRTQNGVRREDKPISNFELKGGSLKFQGTNLASRKGSRGIGAMILSEEDVTIFPGPYRGLAPINVKEATVETLGHGRGQYRKMFSFVYLPSEVAKRLQPRKRASVT